MKKPQCSSSSATAEVVPRIERKVIEKSRRNRMKILYSNLISLLPNQSRKEGSTLLDQIDEAVEYIKNLKMKMEKLREKKESLFRRFHKPAAGSSITIENQDTKKKSPSVEVHEMGPYLDVILANGLQDYSKFHGIIMNLLHAQPGVEIVNANFSRDGNTSIQVVQDKVGMGCGVATSAKLKELVCGTSSNDEQVMGSQLKIWDYDIESSDWDFQILN